MTQETKLGLIIGGLFIFCFALILSNTEDERLIDQQVATLMDASPTQDPIRLEAQNGRLSQNHIEDNIQPPQTDRSPQANPDQISLAVNDASESKMPLAGQALPSESTPTERIQLRQPSPQTPIPPRQRVDAIANRPLSVADSKPTQLDTHIQQAQQSDRAVLQAKLDALTSKPIRQPQPRRVQIYVVAANDNLTKIARKFYGQADQEHIDRIFKANRKQLKDLNSLRIGQKLEIPIESNTQPSTKKRNRAIDPTQTASASSSSKWRWYQVKDHDRYTRIAKEQLGDTRRWKEIYELNKSVFPDPDQIRAGVRIKLPINRKR